MTLWQINQNVGWWITKYEASDPPFYYQWSGNYDLYNYREAKLVVEWMNTLKEMNE